MLHPTHPTWPSTAHSDLPLMLDSSPWQPHGLVPLVIVLWFQGCPGPAIGVLPSQTLDFSDPWMGIQQSKEKPFNSNLTHFPNAYQVLPGMGLGAGKTIMDWDNCRCPQGSPKKVGGCPQLKVEITSCVVAATHPRVPVPLPPAI